MASDGDRDGLPNVLMEAQIMGLPVAATRMAAIPELVVDGETGVLVDPGDAAGAGGSPGVPRPRPGAPARGWRQPAEPASAPISAPKPGWIIWLSCSRSSKSTKPTQPSPSPPWGEGRGEGVRDSKSPQCTPLTLTLSPPRGDERTPRHADRLLRASETTDSPDAVG